MLCQCLVNADVLAAFPLLLGHKSSFTAWSQFCLYCLVIILPLLLGHNSSFTAGSQFFLYFLLLCFCSLMFMLKTVVSHQKVVLHTSIYLSRKLHSITGIIYSYILFLFLFTFRTIIFSLQKIQSVYL